MSGFQAAFPKAGAADVVIDVLADDMERLPELWGCLYLVSGHERAQQPVVTALA